MQAIGQLAGGVAHDFNNQLTIIIGYSEMLLEMLGDDEFAREPLELIRNAAEHCGALTRQLLVYSRMQVHLPAVLDLNKVVQDCEEALRKVVGDDVELITLLDPDLGRIEADPSLLEQVLLNLAVNARRHAWRRPPDNRNSQRRASRRRRKAGPRSWFWPPHLPEGDRQRQRNERRHQVASVRTVLYNQGTRQRNGARFARRAWHHPTKRRSY